MKVIKKLCNVILFILVSWSFLNTARPFWNRIWLEMEVETATVYGMKNSIEDTRRFLSRKMREKGYDLEANDFIIEKDEDNRVSINIAYTDRITIFGVVLKQLEFLIESRGKEVKAFY